MAVLLALMLLQPVWVSVWTETHRKTVVVLVDISASMRIADRQLPAHEKLRLAEAFSVRAARRPFRLEEQARALRDIADSLQGELDWLNSLSANRAADLKTRLGRRRKRIHDKCTDAAEALAEQLKPIDAVLAEVKDLPAATRAALRDAKAKLTRTAAAGLKSAAGATDTGGAADLPGRAGLLRGDLRRAITGLRTAAPTLDTSSARLDAMLYGQLGEQDRADIDGVAQLTRAQLARAVLLHRRAGDDDKVGEGLLAQLRSRYVVKVYTFAASPAEAETESWADPLADTGDANARTQPTTTSAPAGLDDALLGTNLAGALHKALQDTGGDDLAGVIVLTDGQDNGRDACEPLVRQLAARGAAFSAVAIGADQPPTDAAIISVQCPDTVFKEDRMYVDAEIKLDGLKGRNVKVSLYDGDRRVADKTIRVSTDTLRRRVQLADEPKTAGVHTYRLEVAPSPADGDDETAEVFTDNNAYTISLTVTEDRTKLLLVDARPRWEFRYLRNLFRGRDKTVRLQHVLIHPDRFQGQPSPSKPTFASAARPLGAEEATDLPVKVEEWMKFDVVILGDLAPADFGPRLDAKQRKDPAKVAAAEELAQEQMRSLRTFVADRGGTLILIAGNGSMPAAFAKTELAELIPLQLGEAGPPVDRQGYRITPTGEGARHVALRQDVDPAQSQAIWKSFAPIYWRSRYVTASPTATVLACAVGPKAPKWLTGPDPTTSPTGLQKRRRDYQRSHALISVAPHGLGKVMVLGFDRTWRLRYRVGDTRHHKFWGQVMRWATEGKLPAGTELVKLGTDRTRYPPHSRPIVRAKIVEKDYRPVVSDQVSVKVLSGEDVVGRFPMRYASDSPGMYTATLDELPAGVYRLELDAPEAAALLEGDGPAVVATTISVNPSTPDEQVELACNRDLLSRLAGLSDGGEAVTPDKAASLLASLPAGKVSRTGSDELALWDSWWLLVLFAGVATAEWVLRKRVGLT